MSYADRAQTHNSSVARALLENMIRKESNLCASLDVRSTKELLELCDKVGPYVCLIKTHIDIIDDFSEETVVGLQKLSKKHDFLLFEDRKFADIGSTVKAQYTGGVYKIAQWAHITNAHGVPGDGIVSGLEEGAKETTSEPRGLIMLAELSCKGSIATGEYSRQTVEIAARNSHFVFGFIAQNKMQTPGQDWLILTPGVGLDDKGDGLGQQYRPVEEVIMGGSDVIIVGRGLYGKGRDPVAECQRYKRAGWDAYLKRLNK